MRTRGYECETIGMERWGTRAKGWGRGAARQCEIQLSYGLGQARPVSVQAETLGTGSVPDAKIASLVERHMGLSREVTDKAEVLRSRT